MTMSSPMSPRPLKIVVLVSGRGTNLQAIIDAKSSQVICSQIQCVISNVKEALALQRAQEAKVPTKLIESHGKSRTEFFSNLHAELKALNPDLIVLAGFMKILSEDIIDSFYGKMINIHPSLLPAFPGLSAQKQALEAGVKITGCTVHFVDKGCDTGPIILQKAEPIYDHDTVESLSARLLQKEHTTLVETISLLERDMVVLQGNRTLLKKQL